MLVLSIGEFWWGFTRFVAHRLPEGGARRPSQRGRSGLCPDGPAPKSSSLIKRSSRRIMYSGSLGPQIRRPASPCPSSLYAPSARLLSPHDRLSPANARCFATPPHPPPTSPLSPPRFSASQRRLTQVPVWCRRTCPLRAFCAPAAPHDPRSPVNARYFPTSAHPSPPLPTPPHHLRSPSHAFPCPVVAS